MSSFVEILILVGVVVATGVLTRILLPVFILIAQSVFGPERFVEDGLDGCGYFGTPGIISALLFMIFPVFEAAREKSHHLPVHVHLSTRSFWVIPVVAVCYAIYGVVELWQRGVGHRKQEFSVGDGKIIRLHDGAQLYPLFVTQKRDYNGTTPVSGYTLYGISLYDADGSLAQNGYLTETETEQTLDDVLAVAAPEGCRAMQDLWLVWDEDGKRLHEVTLDQKWVPLICHLPREPMSPERQWWEQWLMPKFPKDGQSEIDSAEFARHLSHLHETYPIQFAADAELEKKYQAAHLLLQRTESGILLVARGRISDFGREWSGGKMRAGRWEDGVMVYTVEQH